MCDFVMPPSKYGTCMVSILSCNLLHTLLKMHHAYISIFFMQHTHMHIDFTHATHTHAYWFYSCNIHMCILIFTRATHTHVHIDFIHATYTYIWILTSHTPYYRFVGSQYQNGTFLLVVRMFIFMYTHTTYTCIHIHPYIHCIHSCINTWSFPLLYSDCHSLVCATALGCMASSNGKLNLFRLY